MENNSNFNRQYKLMSKIPGANITWRHMEDNPDNNMYYRKGVRYFAIKLDDSFAEELEALGWPVIWRNENNDENDEPKMQAYLKVFLKHHERYPLRLYLINPDMQTKVEVDLEYFDEIHIDKKPIEFIDVIVHPYHWTYGNDSGIKILASSMNILLSQDGAFDLDDDYEVVDSIR